jgi:hypothetical protein
MATDQTFTALPHDQVAELEVETASHYGAEFL